MSNETLIIITVIPTYCICATIIGILAWRVLVTEPSDPDDYMLVALMGLVWPVVILAAIYIGTREHITPIVVKMYFDKGYVRRKIKAYYWTTRARREESEERKSQRDT